MKKILLVDDDADLLDALERNFRPHRHTWHLTTALNGAEALSLLQERPFELVITDILMPEREGLEVIMEVRRDHPEIKVIAISGGSRKMSLDVLDVARSFGAHKVLAKPFTADDLFQAIRTLLNEDVQASSPEQSLS